MQIFSSYRDLCIQIEIHQERLRSINDEMKYYENMLTVNSGPKDYKGIKINGTTKTKYVSLPLDRIIDILSDLDVQRNIEKRHIKSLKSRRDKISKKLKQLKGLDFQVCYLRDVESMTLQGIADTLIFSLSYIEKISARNPRETKRVQEI